MSVNANPTLATVWLDCDVFRAPIGTTLPANIFAPTLSGWDAFGGVEVGFTVDKAQDVTDFTVFNYSSGAYKTRKGIVIPSMKFKAVDLSKATTLTLLYGGSITAANGGFKWVEGNGEEFMTIARAKDATRQRAYVMERTEVSNKPTEILNDAQLNGWEFDFKGLAPASGAKAIYPITDTNPLA